ncbi:TetR/AcrR family transcriptional regulator [Rhizobiaceae bacterium BDR2-2]|uniref:TetR/AcrR family transcriptional regulator n=1 Tax=Ectorhizobium quercum TaxID=2965071 RepID=A0AAE3SWE6_9HYPH|nr:TetR/AcrR family transcriptional regulator [Ectorhizobium quercum]MCX8997944.1 TetR/AcrR family transcriptional regulator [Ectorhizobium quercum]
MDQTMKATVGRPRGRPKTAPDDTRRKRITAMARNLFLERGYEGTSMGDVASAARVSFSTIYRLFPGKADLFAAVVSLHRHSMVALPGDYDDLPIEDALMRIFRVDIDTDAERERRAVMNMFIAESRRVPELEPILTRQGPAETHALLSAWLERQQACGRIDIADSAIAARMLMDVAFGAPVLKDGWGHQWPGDADRSHYLRHCFSMLAAGLRPRGATPGA